MRRFINGLLAVSMAVLLLAGCTSAGETATATANLPGPVTPDTAVPAATATSEPIPPGGSVIGTSWQLISFGPIGEETAVLDDATITLQFDSETEASGFGGCNSYSSQYQTQDGAIAFSETTRTLMDCADQSITEQEQLYFDALQTTGAYEVAVDHLTIWYDGRQSVMNFIPVAPVADATETPASSGQIMPIHDIQMVDAQNGWAIGIRQESQPARVLLTSDGGQTWQARTPEGVVAPSDSVGDYPAAYFASTTQGWVSYPHLTLEDDTDVLVWSTSDGGQTWQSSAPLDFTDIPMDHYFPSDLTFMDAQFGWLLAHLGVGMSHDYIAVFTTNDGGQTWQRLADPENAPDIQACPKSGLVFTSQQDGWLAGDCPGLMPPLFLYQTSDGGQTWQAATLPVPEGLEATTESLGNQCGVSQIETVPASAVYLTLHCTDFEQNTSQAWLYSTSDGDDTWQIRPLPLSSVMFSFISGEEGWLLGTMETAPDVAATPLVYYTSDSGQNWLELTAVPHSGIIEFVDSQHGWIVGGDSEQPALLFSKDGGASWEEIPQE